MNIFKVMASGRKRYSEEYCSAVLAWLLHPNMEHGLGSIFLKKFLENVASNLSGEARDALISLASSTEPVLRSGGVNSQISVEIHLEKNVANNFIDVVVKLDNLWLCIENKIYAKSVNQEKTQFRMQYAGLRGALDDPSHRIVSIYLVPDLSAEIITGVREVDGLNDLHPGDHKILFLWREPEEHQHEETNLISCGSVGAIICQILDEEQCGRIEPLSEYLRHTLKALLVFINSDFAGYPFSSPAGSSGLNPATNAVIGLNEIRAKQSGYVGVQWGENGLLRLTPSDLRSRKFQFTEQEMESKNWIERERFLAISDWTLGGARPHLSWHGKLSVDNLLRVAKAYGDNVYIGIRGGLNELQKLGNEELLTKSWQIGPEKESSNWIGGNDFVACVEPKLKAATSQ